MDGIQAIESKAKANPAANAGAAANDDDSVTGAFAALLNLVGSSFKSTDTSAALDSKLIRNDNETRARADDGRDTVKKARDEKHDDRAAAKKASKARDDDSDDDAKTDEAQATDDNDDTQDAAADTDASADQAAAQTAAEVAADVPLVTTETVAPVLVAQQVQTATDQGATEDTTVVDTVADTDAITEVSAVTDAVANTVQKAVAAEAPAATQKAAEVAGPSFKQAVAQTTVTDDAPVAEEATTTTVAAKTDADAAKGKDAAQVAVTTQRSAAAQAQSQDLSAKVGPDTKAQVHVTVTTHAAAQTLNTNSVYDIYSGYNAAQTSTANGQAGTGDATNALVGTKNPAETAQAQAAPPASPALAPQPQTPVSQQGATPSAVRADIAAPAPAQTGGQSSTSFGESAFGASAGANTQTSATTAGTATTATATPQATAQQVIDQIKVNITRAAKAGLDSVTIQLKPKELGRIEVHLEMSEEHKVRVTVTADNKDTLSLLQQDARTLERTLHDAGLRTDSNNLHFNLRSDSEAQTAGDGKSGSQQGSNAENGGATDEGEDIAMTYDYAEAARARGGIDTFA